MKQVLLASLLAAAGAVSVTPFAVSQAAPAPGATGAAGATGQVQMSQDEYNAYQKGVTATSPADKASAFEAYLKAINLSSTLTRDDADKLTDPAAKQAGLDQAASFAQRGLNATEISVCN